eukprot:g30805.t1
MWSLLWLCLWGVEGLDLPSNNSLAETRARWSCLDCNSSLHWGLDEIWNLFLAIFSFVGAVRTVPQLLGALWEYGFAYTVCRRAIFYYGHGPAGFWVCLFIFSKYLELIDTVFLVMRKRLH